METFALTCTTCKSRLKVRDAAAIGQIMACPKCGGMVLVKLPEGPVASASSDGGDTRADLSGALRPAPPPATHAPLKSDAFDAIDELLGNVPARNMVPTPTVKPTSPQAAPRMEPPRGTPPTVVRSTDPRKSPDSQAKTVSQEELPGVKAPPAKIVASPEVTVNSPSAHQTVAKGQSTSTAAPATAASPTKATRTAATAAIGAVAVAPPAAAKAVPVAKPGSIPVPTDDDPGPPGGEAVLPGTPWQYWAIVFASGLVGVALAVGVVLVAISWLAEPPSPDGPTVAQVPVDPKNSAAGNGSSADDPKPLENPTPPTAPVQPMTSVPAGPEADPKPTEEGPDAPAPAKPAEPKPMPTVPMPPMPPATIRDPLGLTDPVPAPQPNAPADDPLKKFDNFLGGDSDPMPAPVAEAKPLLPPPDDEPANSPTSPLLPKPDPRPIDFAARLADPLPAIEVKDSPLADFLQVMQDLSTVPITLRPDGLSMVKLVPFSPETPVTWQGRGTNVLEAIQGALAPLGLEARVEGDQLVVDVVQGQLASLKMNVQDLTSSDETLAAQLAETLQAIVAPDSWCDNDAGPNIVANKNELLIKQQRVSLAECVLVLEKLRKARGLAPQSRFDAKLFDLTPRADKAAAALATPITLNYSQPTLLQHVLERLGSTAGVRILVDWQALDAAGWNPSGEVTLIAEKQPLAKTLDELTQRMEVAWRIVDARTLQVTSRAVLADHAEFELYPLGELAKDEAAGQALIGRLRVALGNQHFRDAGGPGELHFDLAGRCLLASLPQPQQRQLAQMLAALRQKDK